MYRISVLITEVMVMIIISLNNTRIHWEVLYNDLFRSAYLWHTFLPCMYYIILFVYSFLFLQIILFTRHKSPCHNRYSTRYFCLIGTTLLNATLSTYISVVVYYFLSFFCCNVLLIFHLCTVCYVISVI